jgi:hypothetical protein
MGKIILDIALWIILASVAVLVIMNPTGFATDVSAVGTQVNTLSTTLSGSGYKLAR